MISYLCDKDFVTFYLINNPVFLVDSAGPVAGQVVTERFGLSNTLIPVALNVAK